MSATQLRAGLVPMDNVGRAQAIREKLAELGTPSVRQLNKLGGGDEATISKILNGDEAVLNSVREGSFLTLERTLREMEIAFPSTAGKSAGRLDVSREPVDIRKAEPSGDGGKAVVVRFEGVYGIKSIEFEGPVEELPEAIAAIQALIDRAQKRQAPEDD